MKQERVMVFIDGSNLFRSFRCFRKGYRADIDKLLQKLIKDRRLIRAIYYASYSMPPKEKQFKLFDSIQKLGIEVKTFQLRDMGKGVQEKGLDITLAVDMLTSAYRDEYDTAILVSGDGDYISLVRAVKLFGKNIEIASFECSVSSELKRYGNPFISLDEIADEIAIES